MASRNLVLMAALSAATLFAIPVTSLARVNVQVDIAPPAVIYEAPPPPRVGYIWTPGYWDWDAHRHDHVWHKGQYVRDRRGEHWVAHEWVEHDGHYRLNQGHWEHDADRRDHH